MSDKLYIKILCTFSHKNKNEVIAMIRDLFVMGIVLVIISGMLLIFGSVDIMHGSVYYQSASTGNTAAAVTAQANSLIPLLYVTIGFVMAIVGVVLASLGFNHSDRPKFEELF